MVSWATKRGTESAASLSTIRSNGRGEASSQKVPFPVGRNQGLNMTQFKVIVLLEQQVNPSPAVRLLVLGHIPADPTVGVLVPLFNGLVAEVPVTLMLKVTDYGLGREVELLSGTSRYHWVHFSKRMIITFNNTCRAKRIRSSYIYERRASYLPLYDPNGNAQSTTLKKLHKLT